MGIQSRHTRGPFKKGIQPHPRKELYQKGGLEWLICIAKILAILRIRLKPSCRCSMPTMWIWLCICTAYPKATWYPGKTVNSSGMRSKILKKIYIGLESIWEPGATTPRCFSKTRLSIPKSWGQYTSRYLGFGTTTSLTLKLFTVLANVSVIL